MNRLPDTAFHRNVELLVLKSSEQGIKTHIVLPSTIYGVANHLLVQKGISNPTSIQMPQLILASIDRGQGGILGKGANLWPDIHISESEHFFQNFYFFSPLLIRASCLPSGNGVRGGFGRQDGYWMARLLLWRYDGFYSPRPYLFNIVVTS